MLNVQLASLSIMHATVMHILLRSGGVTQRSKLDDQILPILPPLISIYNSVIKLIVRAYFDAKMSRMWAKSNVDACRADF